jgi:hypothetical protein
MSVSGLLANKYKSQHYHAPPDSPEIITITEVTKIYSKKIYNENENMIYNNHQSLLALFMGRLSDAT